VYLKEGGEDEIIRSSMGDGSASERQGNEPISRSKDELLRASLPDRSDGGVVILEDEGC